MNSTDRARTDARKENAQAASRFDRTGTEEMRRGKRVLLGFLGSKNDKNDRNNKQRTRYVLSKAPGDEGEERSWETEMITEALCRFFAPEETVLFLTKKAREAWEEDIATRLASWNPRIVDIPDGYSEEEMYDIMAAVVEAMPEEGTALLDITHGFRSLPALMLFAVFYAMAIKKTDVESILYGAFRSDGTEEEKAITPVLRMDLLLYLTRLAQWTNTFATTGTLPSETAESIKKRHTSPKVSGPINCLTKMAMVLRTGLVPHLGQSLQDLQKQIETATDMPPLERVAFSLVANSYMKAMGICHHTPTESAEHLESQWEHTKTTSAPSKKTDDPKTILSPKELETELALARWLFDHQHIPQCSFLLREFAVNLLILRRNNPEEIDNWLDFDGVRSHMEKLLREHSGAEGKTEPLNKDDLLNITKPKESDVLAMWLDSLRNQRNWMAHMGFEKSAVLTKRLGKLEEQVHQSLKKAESEWRRWLTLPFPSKE